MDRLRQIVSESIKSVLKESAGLFDGCEKLADEIIRQIMNLNWHINPPSNNDRIQVPASWSPSGYVCVNVKKIPGKRGAYDNFRFERDHNVVIYISPFVLTEPRNELMSTLCHELTHAYEDVMRWRNNAVSIEQQIHRDGIDKANRYLTKTDYWDRDETLEDVAKFMIMASSYEKNARISQFLPYLMNAQKTFQTPDDAYLYLDETQMMRNLLFMKGFTESILHPESEEEKQEYLNAFKQVSNLDFKNYKKLKRYCKKVFDKHEAKVLWAMRNAVNQYFELKRS